MHVAHIANPFTASGSYYRVAVLVQMEYSGSNEAVSHRSICVNNLQRYALTCFYLVNYPELIDAMLSSETLYFALCWRFIARLLLVMQSACNDFRWKLKADPSEVT